MDELNLNVENTPPPFDIDDVMREAANVRPGADDIAATQTGANIKVPNALEQPEEVAPPESGEAKAGEAKVAESVDEAAKGADPSDRAESVDEAKPDVIPVEAKVNELGGLGYIEKAVNLYSKLASAQFNAGEFLDQLYTESSTRYNQLLVDIASNHKDDLAQFLFGTDAATIQARLTGPAPAPGASAPDQDAEIAKMFNMDREAFDILPDEAQDSLRKVYAQAKDRETQEAQARERVEAEKQQDEFTNWNKNCNAAIGQVCDSLKITDPDLRARVESLTYGALTRTPEGAEVFQTAIGHLNNREYNLVQGITPRLHTMLSVIAAKEAAPFIELEKLRAEVAELKRTRASSRIEIRGESNSPQTITPPSQPINGATAFDDTEIAAHMERIRAAKGIR
jgi:hypothetical protein